ncbi:hypothetical protein CFP56_014171 [Quercus suber]|uniref:Small ribosomal subunit protein mS29 n=1 Tax=Quercus suber TaxID=58331 RepID=A0AAW0KU55_QUESU
MLQSILRAATATSSKPKPKPHSWTLRSSPIPKPAKTLSPTSNSGTQIKISTKTHLYYSLIIDNLYGVLEIGVAGGLPTGMVKEFEDSLRPALLVRQSFLDLRDNFRLIVDPPLTLSHSKGPKLRKQVVLDGPVSCGKSIALAMLGRDWTHGGFFYKNPNTGLWDIPLQAEMFSRQNHNLFFFWPDFLKWNESH